MPGHFIPSSLRAVFNHPLSETHATSARWVRGTIVLLAIGAIALLVAPVPTWALDVLILSQWALGIAILATSLMASQTIAIPSYPGLILLVTVLRLALSVAASRLILLHADAGAVVTAVGRFVIHGDVAVGALSFVTLAIVQWMVIVKGAERVAEVSARFMLDALPGKQHAIEADVRAGTLDAHEGRAHRDALERENRFYGAMDGAMKFVKGEAVATLLIVGINFFGGAAIGVNRHGMGMADAVRRYGVLAVGEGLAAQVPALLFAVAAGVIVTRIDEADSASSVAAGLFRPLAPTPAVLRLLAALLIVLAFAPRFPVVALLTVASCLLAIAQLERHAPITHSAARASVDALAPLRRIDAVRLGENADWCMEIGSGLAYLLTPSTGARLSPLQTIDDAVRGKAYLELGVAIPPVSASVNQILLPHQIVLVARSVPIASFVFNEGRLAHRTLEQRVFNELRPHLSEFLRITGAQALLDEASPRLPRVLRCVVPQTTSIAVFSQVLRQLVDEGISIRDLRMILEALVTRGAPDDDPLELIEEVRVCLRRSITYTLTSGSPELNAIVLDPPIEETIRRAIVRAHGTPTLAMAPRTSRDLLDSIEVAIDQAGATSPSGKAGLVIVAPRDIRRFVRALIAPQFPEVAVVSFAELMPQVIIRPIARAHVRDVDNRTAGRTKPPLEHLSLQ